MHRRRRPGADLIAATAAVVALPPGRGRGVPHRPAAGGPHRHHPGRHGDRRAAVRRPRSCPRASLQALPPTIVPLMRPSGGLSHPAAKPIRRRAPVACANLASVVADGHLRPPFRRTTTGRVACIRPAGLPLRESRARASHHHRVSCRELRTAASPLAARTPPGDIARTRHALYPFDSPAGSRSCRPQKRRVRVGPVVLPPAPGPATRSTLPLLEIHESRSC